MCNMNGGVGRPLFTRFYTAGSPCAYFGRGDSVGFPQHPDQHGPKRPVLLAVDQ
jgi:hypothetical protein